MSGINLKMDYDDVYATYPGVGKAPNVFASFSDSANGLNSSEPGVENTSEFSPGQF